MTVFLRAAFTRFFDNPAKLCALPFNKRFSDDLLKHGFCAFR
ncbi:hypothetical protein [Neisseria sicca]|nr:hypothetical protein [Neisseria sicca]